MTLGAAAAALREEARATDERRLLVLAGEREACYGAADRALDAADVDRAATTLVGTGRLDCERLGPRRSDRLLGTTRDCVVLDCHADFRPNAVGRTVGAVDGGGLFVLLVPPLDAFADRRTDFDRSLAVAPYDPVDVTGRFRRRFVGTLRAHPGIAIVDADAGTVVRDGLTRPAPRRPGESLVPPDDRAFPEAAYRACLTADQMGVVRDLEALREDGRAVVVEADRGRGKSSAAGIAAGALAAEGADVLVTAPEYRNAAAVFVRARDLLGSLGRTVELDRDPPREIRVAGGGRVRYASPTAAADLPGDPDVVFVDEAAALSVRLLERFLDAPRVAFTTTIRGYEGSGRGFSVRFRDRLADGDHEVVETRLDQPIRFAAGDPVEAWAFRTLLLDARPPVEQVVEGASPESVEYRPLPPEDLLADESLLREAFGLLVLAHYRTEPDDVARLLDAPNLAVRALVTDGHVVGVALVAREGNLSAAVREDMYEGGRVRGNMLPDVLTSQLRDEAAGVPEGLRVMRIAVHHAVRSRGLGSRLLAELRAEFGPDVDWLGVGFGATPDLLDFWRENGYRAVQVSTTRNDASGEYSALMLDPTSEAGRGLHDRHARWFVSRIGSMLADPLRDADPDVVRALLRSVDAPVALDLTDWDWRTVAASAYGPGLYDAAPRPFRRVALKHLADPGPDPADLSARAERLLVRKVLQGHPWSTVADELGYHSAGECMRALGDAYEPLVDRYGDEAAAAEKERYID